MSVRVVERASTPGGGLRTEELLGPGSWHDLCSAVHPMAMASPFFRAFGLAERVDFGTPEISYAHPVGRTAGIAFRDLDRTADGLGRDGPAWRSLFTPLLRRLDDVVDFATDHLLQLPRHPWAAGLFGLRTAEFGSAATWNLRFADAMAPAMLAGVAAHAIGPLPGLAPSGAGLLLAALAHGPGWPVPLGGSRTIAQAMIEDLQAHGGRVETGVDVTDLGQLGDPRAVMLDVSPGAADRIGGDRFPGSYRRALRRYRHGDGAATVALLLSEPLPWADSRLRAAPTLHLGGTRSMIAAAERAVAAGRLPERPYVLVGQPGVVDPDRTPAGLHPVWAYTHVPQGSPTDPTRAVLGAIEEVAPGFRDTIVAQQSLSAAELGDHNANLVGGDIANGAVTLAQLVRRPVATTTPWRTPLAGVYLCSAATPPGPGVTGMPGFHAARTALRDVFGLPVPALSPRRPGP